MLFAVAAACRARCTSVIIPIVTLRMQDGYVVTELSLPRSGMFKTNITYSRLIDEVSDEYLVLPKFDITSLQSGGTLAWQLARQFGRFVTLPHMYNLESIALFPDPTSQGSYLDKVDYSTGDLGDRIPISGVFQFQELIERSSSQPFQVSTYLMPQ